MSQPDGSQLLARGIQLNLEDNSQEAAKILHDALHDFDELKKTKGDRDRKVNEGISLANYELGVALSRQGKFAEAKPYFKSSFTGYKKLHGIKACTVRTQYWLCVTLFRLNELDDAEDSLKDAVANWRRLGSKTRLSLETEQWLGKTKYLKGSYKGAALVFRDVLEERTRKFGVNDKDTLDSNHWLARTLCELEHYDEAEKHFHDIIKQCKVLDASETAQSLLSNKHWLAVTLYRRKEYQAAERLLREALAERATRLGPHDADSEESQSLLDLIHSEMRSLAEERIHLPKPMTMTCDNQDTGLIISPQAIEDAEMSPLSVKSQRKQPQDTKAEDLLATRVPDPVAFFFDAEEAPHDPSRASNVDDWFERVEAELHDPIRNSLRNKQRRIKIAILDTGIDMGNELFEGGGGRGQIKRKDFLAPADQNNTGVTNTVGPVENAKDEDGHGTHCAGLLRKVAPAADLYVARIARNKRNIDHEAVAEAIKYACAKEWDVDIISMSFGFEHDWQVNKVLRPAIREAVFKDKLIFAAAANHGNNGSTSYPAWEQGVFAINSANVYGRASDFNPRPTVGEWPFSILGENVESPWICDEKGEPRTIRMTGTSVATPIVAGVAALILQIATQYINIDETTGQSDKMLSWLKSHSGMKNALEAISVKKDGYRNIVPFQLVKAGSDLRSVVSFLEMAASEKTKMHRGPKGARLQI